MIIPTIIQATATSPSMTNTFGAKSKIAISPPTSAALKAAKPKRFQSTIVLVFKFHVQHYCIAGHIF